MSWYSKAWGSTKDWSRGHHWGYSAGAGGAGGALLGAGIGYGFGGGEGSAWGAGIGALGGAAGGYGFHRHLMKAPAPSVTPTGGAFGFVHNQNHRRAQGGY